MIQFSNKYFENYFRYRLITANSAEEKILEKARSKTKLETLVIKNGNFVSPRSHSALYTDQLLKEMLEDENPGIVGTVSENQLDDFHLFDWTKEFQSKEETHAGLLD